MNNFLLLHAIIISCFLINSYVKAGEVIELTEATFYDHIDLKKEDNWFITFYAPWCQHCKKLYPELNKLSEYLDQKSQEDSAFPKIHVAKIDATKSKEIAKEFGVDKFPRLIYKKANLTGTYDGPRSLDGFQLFLNRFNDPPIQEVATSTNEFELSSIHPYHNVSFILQLNCNLDGNERLCSEDTKKIYTAFRSTAYHLHLHSSFGIVHHQSPSMKMNKQEISICKFSPQHIPYIKNSFQLKITHEDELYCLNILQMIDEFSLAPYGSSLELLEKPILSFIEKNNYPFFNIFENHNFKILSHLNKTMIIGIIDERRESTTNSILTAMKTQFHQIVLENPNKRKEIYENYILGYLDGNKWKSFVRHHDAYVPNILVIDHEDERHHVLKLAKSAKATERYSNQVKDLYQRLMIENSIEMIETTAPGIFGKMIHRFKKHFPYSILLLIAPSILVIVAIKMFPFPNRRKAKKN